MSLVLLNDEMALAELRMLTRQALADLVGVGWQDVTIILHPAVPPETRPRIEYSIQNAPDNLPRDNLEKHCRDVVVHLLTDIRKERFTKYAEHWRVARGGRQA